MRKLVLLGLAVAVCSAGALASAGAAVAAEPAFYECKAVKAGKFEKGCKKEGGKGGYELVEGVGKGKAFKGSGRLSLQIPAVGGEAKCEGNKEQGFVTTPTHVGKLVIVGTRCTFAGKECKTRGAKRQEVTSNPLEGDIGYLGKAEKRVGIDLKAEGGGLMWEMVCSHEAKGEKALEVEVSGSVIGEMTPVNEITKRSDMTFEVSYTKLEGLPEDVPLAEIVGVGTFNSGLEGHETSTGEELELKG